MGQSHNLELQIIKSYRDFINNEIRSLNGVPDRELESEFTKCVVRYHALKITLDTREIQREQKKILERQNRTTKTCLFSLEQSAKKRRLTRKEKKELEKIRLQQAIKKLVEEWQNR